MNYANLLNIANIFWSCFLYFKILRQFSQNVEVLHSHFTFLWMEKFEWINKNTMDSIGKYDFKNWFGFYWKKKEIEFYIEIN